MISIGIFQRLRSNAILRQPEEQGSGVASLSRMYSLVPTQDRRTHLCSPTEEKLFPNDTLE